jgi:hypothetical protein
MGFEREVSRVVEENPCVGIIALVGSRARRQEKGIIFAPDSQSRAAIGTEVFLKLRIERHVALVVTEEIEMDFHALRAIEQRLIECDRLGSDAAYSGPPASGRSAWSTRG